MIYRTEKHFFFYCRQLKSARLSSVDIVQNLSNTKLGKAAKTATKVFLKTMSRSLSSLLLSPAITVLGVLLYVSYISLLVKSHKYQGHFKLTDSISILTDNRRCKQLDLFSFQENGDDFRNRKKIFFTTGRHHQWNR